MRPYVKDIIIFALMIGTGFLARWQWNELGARMDRLATSQGQFSERVQAAIKLPEKERYLGSIQGFLQVYRKALSEISEDKVRWSDELRTKAERQHENGAINDKQYEKRARDLALVRNAFETLIDARWNSQLTLPGKSDTRLDIYQVQQGRDSNGNFVLEAEFFLWGIEPGTEVLWGRRKSTFWRKRTPDAEAAGDPQRASDAEKPSAEGPSVVARSEGSAQPSVFIEQPTLVVSHFPSSVAIGTFELPQIPGDATHMDLELDYTVRKGEADETTRLAWKKVPISAAWRVTNTATTPPK